MGRFLLALALWLSVVIAPGFALAEPAGCAQISSSREDMITLLRKADKLRFGIDFEIDPDQIIGHVGRAEVAAVTGKFTTMTGVMSVLGQYFSEEAAKIEMYKIGLCCIGDRVGFIMASGEEGFTIDDHASFSFMFEGDQTKLIEVVMIGDYGTRAAFYYLLKVIQDRWLIVDEVNEEDQRFDGQQWVAIRCSSRLIGRNVPYGMYHSDRAYDMDLKTAWVEGKEGDGIGEWMDFRFCPSRNMRAIEIVNGYAKSKTIYLANNRVKRLRLSFDDGSSVEAELTDGEMGPQVIEFAEPKAVERVRLTILEVYRGSKYRDTCISEVEFR